MCSILVSSETLEFEERQMKQCRKNYCKNPKNPPVIFRYFFDERFVSLLGIELQKIVFHKCSVASIRYGSCGYMDECIKVSAFNLVENKQTFSQIEVISLLKICMLA
jgi:hypothetical protein